MPVLQTASPPSGRPPADVTESTDAPAGTGTGYAIGEDGIFQGRIDSTGDSDWIRVQLTGGVSYVFSAWGIGGSGDGLGDTEITIYDASGHSVSYSDDMSSTNLFTGFSYTPSRSGTYYVAVDGFGSATGSYRMTYADSIFKPDQIATQITEIGWGVPGPLAFDVSADHRLTVDITALTAEGQQLARWALSAWADLAGLTFAETDSNADITFNDDQPGAFAGPSSYDPATGVINRSSVNVSAAWLDSYGTTIDSYSMQAYIHEIGHALGLAHAGPYDGSTTYGSDNYYTNNSVLETVMSYFGAGDTPWLGADAGTVVTPMLADVIAIQRLYGTPDTIHGGNTVYGAGSTAGGYLGALFGFIFGETAAPAGIYAGDPVIMTLVDSDGTDRIDLTGLGSADVVDLRPGQASSIGGHVSNLLIDVNTVIENVRTGAGADEVQGNAAANRIDLGAGDDIARGGDGDDILIGGTGADRLWGGGGDDTLIGGLVDAAHDGVTAQVYRIYEATLGRAPDVGGLTDWTGRLIGGVQGLQDIADRFIASAEFQSRYGNTTDAEFITLLYHNVLGRAPDAGSFAIWVDRLDSGSWSRAEVVLGFSESAEFTRATGAAALGFSHEGLQAQWTDEVYRLYGATLDRAPDGGGLAAWTEALAGGRTLRDVADGFLHSSEFQSRYGNTTDAEFVTLLYHNVLGRAPDAGSFTIWIDRLGSGAWSRAEVVLSFANSAENVSRTADALTDYMQGPIAPHDGDRLEGGAGNDILMGGFGADVFVFDATSAGGTDRVAGLEPWDRIELTGFGYADAADALSDMTQLGADVVLTSHAPGTDPGTDLTVIFEDTRLADIHTDMLVV